MTLKDELKKVKKDKPNKTFTERRIEKLENCIKEKDERITKIEDRHKSIILGIVTIMFALLGLFIAVLYFYIISFLQSGWMQNGLLNMSIIILGVFIMINYFCLLAIIIEAIEV